MLHNHDRLGELFKKRMDDTLSSSEEAELDELLSSYSDEELSEALEEAFSEVTTIDDAYHNHDWEAVRQSILSHQRPSSPNIRFLHKPLLRCAAAAIVIIVAGLTAWLLRSPSEQTCGLKLPGERDGILKIHIVNDTITYSIPRSWQYTHTLPDGSKVWLNAASSISYVRWFKGNKREVKLEGEAYFELAKNDSIPFYVTANGRQTAAPGNHFNINAYEGQFLVSLDNSRWKEGYFAFQNADIKETVNELARWYDWKVIYGGAGVQQMAVNGSFCRNTSELGALKKLRSYGINFHKKGNEIIIN